MFNITEFLKFRGARLDNNEVICSGAIDHTIDNKGKEHYYLKDLNNNWIECDSKSITQLIGFDENDFDVFQGDQLTNDNGQIFTAKLAIILENDHTWEPIQNIYGTFYDCKLSVNQ